MESEIKLEIVGLVYNQSAVSTFGLVLGEANGKRRFLITIGEPEANAIALKLNNKTPSRPLAHDLMNNIIVTLNTKLKKVVICKVLNEVYYSELYIEDEQGKIYVVDARTSDAVALAIRAEECPIYIKSNVLDIVGIEIRIEEGAPKANTKKNPDSFTDEDWNLLSEAELKDLLDTVLKEEKYELAVKIRDVLKEK